MLNLRTVRLAESFLALLLLSAMGASQSQAQTSTYSFAAGTTPGTVSSANGLLLFTPTEASYLVSFAYLGTDGTTPLADGQLFYIELPADNYSEVGFGSISEDQISTGFIGLGVNSGASSVGGSWALTSSPLLLTPDHSYLLYTNGSVENVGIGESGDGRNGGMTWIGFAVQGDTYFNYSLEVTPVPEPATCSILAGVVGFGLTVLRRRPSRRN